MLVRFVAKVHLSFPLVNITWESVIWGILNIWGKHSSSVLHILKDPMTVTLTVGGICEYREKFFFALLLSAFVCCHCVCICVYMCPCVSVCAAYPGPKSSSGFCLILQHLIFTIFFLQNNSLNDSQPVFTYPRWSANLWCRCLLSCDLSVTFLLTFCVSAPDLTVALSPTASPITVNLAWTVCFVCVCMTSLLLP